MKKIHSEDFFHHLQDIMQSHGYRSLITCITKRVKAFATYSVLFWGYHVGSPCTDIPYNQYSYYFFVCFRRPEFMIQPRGQCPPGQIEVGVIFSYWHRADSMNNITSCDWRRRIPKFQLKKMDIACRSPTRCRGLSIGSDLPLACFGGQGQQAKWMARGYDGSVS